MPAPILSCCYSSVTDILNTHTHTHTHTHARAHPNTRASQHRQCVEQAAQGCTALLTSFHGSPGAGGLAEADTLLIVRTAATGLAPHLQALAQPQRATCLRLMLVAIQVGFPGLVALEANTTWQTSGKEAGPPSALDTNLSHAATSQVWGPAALRAGGSRAGAEAGGLNLLEAAIAAVDGEKDPRCLLASFKLLQVAILRTIRIKGMQEAGQCSLPLWGEGAMGAFIRSMQAQICKLLPLHAKHTPIAHHFDLQSACIHVHACAHTRTCTHTHRQRLVRTVCMLQEAVRVYHAPGVDPTQLQSQAEEVVEVVSCYFPIAFTPPKNDPHR